MPNKSFSIYSSDDFTIGDNDRLVVEIAKSHVACVVSNTNSEVIRGYELFSCNEQELNDLPKLFTDLSLVSDILNHTFSSCKFYFNTEFCVPVPIFKFNKDIAAEYLNIVFGEDASSKIQFEHLPIEPGIMNVFRVDDEWISYLNSKFSKVSYHHTYSNIISRVGYKSSALPQQFISIQFYTTFMIVTVMKDGQFHLIQTFAYEIPEDVLYYLLNLTQQLELFSEKLTIQISGTIDLDFQLYRELIKYFKNVMVQNVTPSVMPLSTDDQPLHFFSPFFNLAL